MNPTPEPENPPAFPWPDKYHPSGEIVFGSPGMTLRDYFAAKSLPAILEAGIQAGVSTDKIAADAYRQADALLKARAAK